VKSVLISDSLGQLIAEHPLCPADRKSVGEGSLARTETEYARGDRKIKVTEFGRGDPVRRVVEIRSGQARSLVAELGQGAPFHDVVRIDPRPTVPSLLIAAAQPAGAPNTAEKGSETSSATDIAWSSGTTMFWRSEPGPDLLTPGSLDGIRGVVALRDKLSAVAGQVQAELAGDAAAIGPLGPEFEAGFQDAAATHDALVTTLGPMAGSRDTPPDVAALREALTRLRQRPGEAKLADRLRVELAARAFLEGHPAEARRLLPARDEPGADPEHAAAVLRDMQAMVAGAGGLSTWPAQEAVKEDERPGSPRRRGPPSAGLGFLLPEAPIGAGPPLPGEDVRAGLSDVFEARLRPVPPPVAREQERIKSILSKGFPHQSARIRHLINRADQGPAELPVADELAETLFARIELHLELLARAAESVRPDALASPDFQGMPAWYPHLLASFLRIPLAPAECDLITGLDRKGTTIPEIGDRVARARVDALAGLLPLLIDASRSRSYARFPQLHLELSGLIDKLPDNFLSRIHGFVWHHRAPEDEGPDAAGADGGGEDTSETAQTARARLIQVLENPSIVYEGVPENLVEPFHQKLDLTLGGIPTVLHEVNREGRLPEAGRWTEPLLALIAQTRQATRSPGGPGRD
jgi:hypothetical protein